MHIIYNNPIEVLVLGFIHSGNDAIPSVFTFAILLSHRFMRVKNRKVLLNVIFSLLNAVQKVMQFNQYLKIGLRHSFINKKCYNVTCVATRLFPRRSKLSDLY